MGGRVNGWIGKGRVGGLLGDEQLGWVCLWESRWACESAFGWNCRVTPEGSREGNVGDRCAFGE